MADGITHDKLIIGTTPLAAAICAAAGAWDVTAAFALSYAAGGLFLSPDLDTRSLPFKRWGLLRVLWIPYQKMMKHRGSSHIPLVGTAGRILYLTAPVILFLLLNDVPFAAITDWIDQNLRLLTFIFIALEFSAWTHLIADGLILGKRK